MKESGDRLQSTSKMPVNKQTVINIMLTQTILKNELLSVLKPHDLSLEQFNVLRILRGQKGNPLNLQDVQERMVNKMSNTTRLIDKLLLKDFVKRITCEDNRRKIEIYITEQGLEKLKELDVLIEATEERLTANLTIKELQQLNDLLIKLTK